MMGLPWQPKWELCRGELPQTFRTVHFDYKYTPAHIYNLIKKIKRQQQVSEHPNCRKESCPTITAAHRRDAAGVCRDAVRDAVAAGCRCDGRGGCSGLSGLRMIHVHFFCLFSIF